MHIATVTTRHFEFMAAGHTHKAAKSALMRGWAEHCKDYPQADTASVTENDITVDELRFGQCLRDHSPITEPTPTHEI